LLWVPIVQIFSYSYLIEKDRPQLKEVKGLIFVRGMEVVEVIKQNSSSEVGQRNQDSKRQSEDH
jgi:hypothetical protein